MEEPADLYTCLGLKEMGLKREVFEKALAGWSRLANEGRLGNSCILSIADLSQ